MPPTDAELATYWEAQARHYKGLALRLHEQLLATKNQAERHKDRGLHRDRTGDTAARNVDNQRKKRNQADGV